MGPTSKCWLTYLLTPMMTSLLSFSCFFTGVSSRVYAGDPWPNLPHFPLPRTIHLQDKVKLNDRQLILTAMMNAHAEIKKGSFTLLSAKGYPKVTDQLKVKTFFGGGCIEPTLDLFYQHTRATQFKITYANVMAPDIYAEVYNEIMMRGIHDRYGKDYEKKILKAAQKAFAAYQAKVMPFRRFAYVIDASESSEPQWPRMQTELEKAITKLPEHYGFTLVTCHDSVVTELVPGKHKYVTNTSIKHAFTPIKSGWIKPVGEARLIDGIRAALKYKPQLIYLLACDLRQYKARELADLIDLLKKNKVVLNIVLWGGEENTDAHDSPHSHDTQPHHLHHSLHSHHSWHLAKLLTEELQGKIRVMQAQAKATSLP